MTQQYTPAQLKAWAELGPWEWQKLAEFSSPKYSLGPGVLLTDERDGTPWGDTIDQTNAALIAAAPDLARLVLEKEKEIAELKFEAGMKDKAIRLALKRLKELTDQTGTGALFASDIALIRQVMKETSDEAVS